MNAKAYLMQLEKLDRLIENKIIEREQWYLMATNTTAGSAPDTGVRVQSSGSQQRMADAIDRYIDIGSELDQMIRKMYEIRQDIIGVIEQLPAEEYDVLHKRYAGTVVTDPVSGRRSIYRMSFQEIADAHGKSYSWATTTNGTALAHVQRIIDARKVAPFEELLRLWKCGKV